jgi:OPA family glycerol-3-phosphate transporter-like MFS transporter
MQPAGVTDGADPAPSHSRAYRVRRLFNWMALGLTYASFYLARYNVNVAKGTIDKRYFGGAPRSANFIAAGLITYAISEFFTGAIADRIGGRRAVLIGAAGSAIFTVLLALLLIGPSAQGTALLLGLSLLYSASMLFQTFGAMSVVKVNAPWFHLRERGLFGGVFGVLISCGIFVAYWLAGVLVAAHALYWVFLVPGAIMAVFFLVSLIVIRDRPSHAGFQDFDTADATDETPPRFWPLVRRVLGDPVLRVIFFAELCTGFVRETLALQWPDWLATVHGAPPGSTFFKWASFALTPGAIVGGLVAGLLSDRVFGSRRTPVAFIYYLLQLATFVSLPLVHDVHLACVMIGALAAWIFSVHGMLSGTASMDFGGQKAAATATGLLDGIQYAGAGLLALFLQRIINRFGYGVWGLCAAPFSLCGAILMLRVWNARPQPRRAAATVAAQAPAASAAGAS